MTSPQIIGLFVLASLLVQTGIVCLAARVCGLPRRGVGRAAGVVVVQFVLTAGVAVYFLDTADDPERSVFVLFFAICQAGLTILLIQWLFRGGFGPSVGAWTLQLVLGVVAGLGLGFGLREFVHGYQLANSSMTPNLRGFHVTEVLPDGTHLILAANPPDDPNGVPPGTISGAVVAETFEFREVTRPATHTHSADRVLCNRTRPPARWDAIVYRYPKQETIVLVHRLVGLPGERLEIKEGAVWVNGDRQTPPDRLGPIRYTRGVFTPNKFLGRSLEVVLGPDEYFVLGDNTERASDSRYSGPMPRENIIGVVDTIYWPPSRWSRDP